MTYVITQSCCNDAVCAQVCPVGAIHPTPEEREYDATEMLYIDPASCINCDACVDACPVEAIYSEENLPPDMTRYLEINAEYFRRVPR